MILSIRHGQPRFSYAALRILRLFLNDPSAEITGAETVRASGLASGTVYPLLMRFERIGLLESHWEAGNPSELGHPRRRYYRMTTQGLAVSQQAFQKLGQAKGTPVAEGV